MRIPLAYYNENNQYCASWLRNLILAGHIPFGCVDTRPIQEVRPRDLADYTQCHFFAGIAGWGYALRLARWPDNKPVWTGSCPCQPFSVAGKRKGTADPRHLWPHLFSLIKKCRPATVFGEQVAAATDWFTGVRGDLAGVGYAVGGMPIEAACAGAAQFRDRIWFVAGKFSPRLEGREGFPQNSITQRPPAKRNSLLGLESNQRNGLQRRKPQGQRPSPLSSQESSPIHPPLDGWGQRWTESEFRSQGFTCAVASLPNGGPQFIECPDGKWRRLPPPRVRWLGNGIPSRVGALSAYGNAIYPPVAAEFIKAYMECRP